MYAFQSGEITESFSVTVSDLRVFTGHTMKEKQHLDTSWGYGIVLIGRKSPLNLVSRPKETTNLSKTVLVQHIPIVTFSTKIQRLKQNWPMTLIQLKPLSRRWQFGWMTHSLPILPIVHQGSMYPASGRISALTTSFQDNMDHILPRLVSTLNPRMTVTRSYSIPSP